MPGFSGSLFTVVKRNPKYRFRAVTMLFYIKSNCPNELHTFRRSSIVYRTAAISVRLMA
jgi:hypothetical protein